MMNTKETKRSVRSVIGRDAPGGFVASTAVLEQRREGRSADALVVDRADAQPSFQPGGPNICNRGDNACVDSVIAEMQRREAPLDAACSHKARSSRSPISARPTQHRLSALTPGFFQDPAFIKPSMTRSSRSTTSTRGTMMTAPGRRRKCRPRLRRPRPRLPIQKRAQRARFRKSPPRDVRARQSAISLRPSPPSASQSPDGTSRKPDHDKVNDGDAP